MKMLILSGIYPTEGNLSGGIFINKRCIELKKLGVDFKVLSIIGKESAAVKVAKRALKKEAPNAVKKALKINEITWNRVFYKNKLLLILGSKLTPKIRAKAMLSALEKEENLKEYEIISAHWAFPEGYVGKLIKDKYNIPYVLTVHGSDIHSEPLKNEGVKKYTLQALEGADKVIFVSNKLLEQAVDLGYSGENAEVIHNGVDTDSFNIMDKEEVKKKFGLKKKMVGFVGNLIEVKRVDKLPEIFENIKRIYGEVEFLVVGDGELREEIERSCRGKNIKVRFTGRVKPEAVPHYMNAMDLLILPSRKEAWGCVILEANACGVPVVGSEAGGIPEAIGDLGIVVPEGENFEESFGKAVAKLLKEAPYKEKLRERALEYTWKNTVDKEHQLYFQVLRKNS